MTTPLVLQRHPNEPIASKESLLKAPTAKWDHASTKILLDICIEEIHKIGKPGIAFKSKIWEEIRDEFLKRANKDYTQKQLKNRMDTMRDNWSTWKQLLRSETGLGWNPQTRAIDAHTTWWDAKIRENPNYKKFIYQGLEHHDELQFIFGDTVVTSENAWTPAMGVPSGCSVKNIASDVPYEAVDIDDIEINLDDESSPVENSQSKKKRKVQQDMDDKAAKGKSKVGTATAMRKTLERLVQAAESHNEVEKEELAATSHLHGQYSIPNCVEVLKPLKDGGLLNGRQFSYALELMRDSQNRAIVMSLKDSMDNLVDWILVKIQNVMLVCNFDMLFTFVVVGWPGTAHDTRILSSTLEEMKNVFPHPPEGKYYLVDAGYPNMKGYLAPYKGERYHIPDFRDDSQAEGLQEIFNHAHSSLRNVIERTIGVWKKRWHILCDMRPFPLNKQQKIIVATTALHNFIRLCGVEDEEFNRYDNLPGYMDDYEEERNVEISSYNTRRVVDDGYMDRVRTEIAVALTENRNRQ